MLHTKFRADKSKREIVSELVKLGHSYEYAEAIFWENMKEMHDMELKEGISFKEIARHFNEHRLASLFASADAETQQVSQQDFEPKQPQAPIAPK